MLDPSRGRRRKKWGWRPRALEKAPPGPAGGGWGVGKLNAVAVV